MGIHLGIDRCQMHQMVLGHEKIPRMLAEHLMDEASQKESHRWGKNGSSVRIYGSQIDEGQEFQKVEHR